MSTVDAGFADVLSVPTQFSITPSGSLSVAAFLHLALPTALETDPSATTRFIFSRKSPMLQLPAGFVSQSVPPLQTASSLRNRASGTLQDGIQSVIHPSFPNDPLPLWVLSYWVSMSYALENQCDWRASYDWVLARLNVIPADGPELGIVDEVLDVLESLPWDTPLKGFGGLTDLRTTELRSLLVSSPIHGHILDSMIAIVVQCMQASNDEDLQSVSVEPLNFANILHLSDKRWKNYKTDRTFCCLRTIGSSLCEGTLQRVLFPINIDNVHWAVIAVNTIYQSISYADSLGWSWPTEDIDAIHHWLGYHGFARFNKATALQHGEQLDSFSCGIAAINTIKHALFRHPLFTNNQAFSLRMGEFLDLAYDHLELSDPDDNSNNSAYSDSADVEIEETQPSPPTPLTCPPKNKTKLDLRATDADLNTGLFKFFPKVSCDEHLTLAWKPSAQELRDQEQGRHWKKFDMFEKAAAKQREDVDAVRINWKGPLLWPTIETAALRVGYGMSPVAIKHELKQMDPTRFCGISAQVIGRWIDNSGMRPAWHGNVLAHAQRGNLPLITATPPGILSNYPDVMKTIIEDLRALRMVGVALDTIRCRGIIIARLTVSCPEIFETAAKDSSHFRCTESWVKKFVAHTLKWSFHRATHAAQKTPSNADQLCLDQFYRLTLTIRDCAIFHASFYVNIDQTNIVYQPANTTTYEDTSSKQVAVIGQEEKRAFTVVVGISASGNALPFQVIYCGKTAHSLPMKTTPQFKDTQDLGFKLCFSNTDTYWSMFQLMCDYVGDILVPYWTRQKELVGAPDDQECILQLDVWSVHKSIQFCTWLDQQYPWIKYRFVPGGCTGIAQPCDVESLSLLKKDEAAPWLINGYHAINKPDVVKQAFFQCKAGTAFNLSFESMTSHEALHALVETPQADKEAELPFAHAADVKLDASDVAMDAVLQHIALGESSVPDGYSADGLGNLLVDNESESYE
ncbi:hypothetical protein F4604DRAFT_1926276 [Suillus subluteus]|nr:hypothetical protein F4604DRAFT_1926276 [Suillus subluteus]